MGPITVSAPSSQKLSRIVVQLDVDRFISFASILAYTLSRPTFCFQIGHRRSNTMGIYRVCRRATVLYCILAISYRLVLFFMELRCSSITLYRPFLSLNMFFVSSVGSFTTFTTNKHFCSSFGPVVWNFGGSVPIMFYFFTFFFLLNYLQLPFSSYPNGLWLLGAGRF